MAILPLNTTTQHKILLKRALTMIKEAIERYKAPTPMIYEVAGDIILILSVALDGVLIVTEVDYKWIIVNSVLGALGKILLRLAKVSQPVANNKEEVQ